MHLDKCFSCFDVLERGRVPSGVVWGGIALLTGAPELAKVKFILGMYDADRWDNISGVGYTSTNVEFSCFRETN